MIETIIEDSGDRIKRFRRKVRKTASAVKNEYLTRIPSNYCVKKNYRCVYK